MATANSIMRALFAADARPARIIPLLEEQTPGDEVEQRLADVVRAAITDCCRLRANTQ